MEYIVYFFLKKKKHIFSLRKKFFPSFHIHWECNNYFLFPPFFLLLICDSNFAGSENSIYIFFVYLFSLSCFFPLSSPFVLPNNFFYFSFIIKYIYVYVYNNYYFIFIFIYIHCIHKARQWLCENFNFFFQFNSLLFSPFLFLAIFHILLSKKKIFFLRHFFFVLFCYFGIIIIHIYLFTREKKLRRKRFFFDF